MAESPLASSRARWQPSSCPRTGTDTTGRSRSAETASSTVAQWSRAHCAHSRLVMAAGLPGAAKPAVPRYSTCAARPALFTASVVPESHMLSPTTPNRDSQAASPAALLVPSGTAHSTGSSRTSQSMVRETTLATLLSDQNTLVHISRLPQRISSSQYCHGAQPPVPRGPRARGCGARQVKANESSVPVPPPLATRQDPPAGCPSSKRTSAAAGAFRSESKYAAETSVDIVHEGSRKLAGLGVKVGLVESDQGGDVNDGVFGQSRGCCGQEDVAGHGRQAGAGGDDGGDGGIQATGVEWAGLDDQDRAALGGLAAAGLAEIGPPDAAALGHQSSWRARRLRPAAAAAVAESSGPAARSASSICRVSDREASSSRYLGAARAKNSDRLMPSSAACFVACSKVSSGREIAVFIALLVMALAQAERAARNVDYVPSGLIF